MPIVVVHGMERGEFSESPNAFGPNRGRKSFTNSEGLHDKPYIRKKRSNVNSEAILAPHARLDSQKWNNPEGRSSNDAAQVKDENGSG